VGSRGGSGARAPVDDGLAGRARHQVPARQRTHEQRRGDNPDQPPLCEHRDARRPVPPAARAGHGHGPGTPWQLIRLGLIVQKTVQLNCTPRRCSEAHALARLRPHSTPRVTGARRAPRSRAGATSAPSPRSAQGSSSALARQRTSASDDQLKRHLAGPVASGHRHDVGASELPIGGSSSTARCRNEAAR
jgi:hypothetical protein